MKYNNMIYGTLLAILLWFGCTGIRNLGDKSDGLVDQVSDPNKQVATVSASVSTDAERCPYCGQTIGMRL